tara:strand:- start:1529 stop:1759 length:231 start_codon:yes stop_codon:yes gene_type:complete
MMCDHPPAPLSRGDVAREAIGQLTEAQRLALAIEIIIGVSDPASIFHLVRLERTAFTAAQDLTRVQFVNEEMRKCF